MLMLRSPPPPHPAVELTTLYCLRAPQGSGLGPELDFADRADHPAIQVRLRSCLARPPLPLASPRFCWSPLASVGLWPLFSPLPLVASAAPLGGGSSGLCALTWQR